MPPHDHEPSHPLLPAVAPTPDAVPKRVGARLTRNKVALLIAAGHSPAQAAAVLGVNVRTVYRALKDSEVRASLDQLHAQRMQALLDSSMELAPDALETLRAVMDSPIVSPTAKIAAARAALSAVTAIVPLADTDRRIAALEERLGGAGADEAE
ncbi:MAG: helix-turn-helix domain-containing protein [Chloroflexi bacterium]|nr:helix-turn-helix domain-containing protein [Chloroflexota bacterium]